MERYAKGIANDLKDIAMVCLTGRLQNGVVACPQGFPPIGVLLREFGAAFNICEDESNGARRESYRSSSLND
jgi:hypothetical protein